MTALVDFEPVPENGYSLNSFPSIDSRLTARAFGQERNALTPWLRTASIMEPIGALPSEDMEANSLKSMVGPCGLEPQTSIVSKAARYRPRAVS